jgi:hypothetical protein
MFGTLISIGVFGTLIWSFFSPPLAAKVFLILVAIFEGYIFLMSRTGRPDQLEAFSAPHYFNPDEIAVIKKYHLYFKFPFASRDFSAALSAIQLSAFVWVPWLLYQGLWLTAIAIGANYFIAAPLAMQLNPRLFLSRATGAVALFAHGELMAIESALEKLMNQPKEK